MTLAIILLALALLLGPIIGAAGAVAFMRYERAYQRRLDLFQGMLRMRRTWLAPEWVGGLNLAPVEFARFPEVVAAVDTLLARYIDPAWQHPDADHRRRAVLDTETAACDLLLRMAEALRVPMVGSDLRSRPIAPYGWVTDDVQKRASREILNQVLNGQRVLRVETTAPEPRPAPPPQPQPREYAPIGWFDPARANGAHPQEVGK